MAVRTSKKAKLSDRPCSVNLNNVPASPRAFIFPAIRSVDVLRLVSCRCACCRGEATPPRMHSSFKSTPSAIYQTRVGPLHYAFQWRRGDTRVLISAMQPLVQAHVDFSVAHGFVSPASAESKRRN